MGHFGGVRDASMQAFVMDTRCFGRSFDRVDTLKSCRHVPMAFDDLAKNGCVCCQSHASAATVRQELAAVGSGPPGIGRMESVPAFEA